MQTQDLITVKRSLINGHLKKLIPAIDGPHALLFEAARYSLFLPGKRLRPLLTLSTLEDYAIPLQEGLDAACALEMVHTYSLIHDDLPCMDNDDFRRGKPTLHKVYGEGQAVLAGDFLLTHAFETISSHPKLVAILASRAGGNGLIGGQVVDLLSEGKSIDWETLQFMYLGKTAALFSAALEFGAVIAECSDEERGALKKAGELFGIAFQIIDDLEDGKEGSDHTNKKATSLTLFGPEKAREMAASFLDQALRSLPKAMPALETLFLSYSSTN
ncbi:MAG: polyprenyl synthetase family protein [Chlamydiia bacterium]|nr:polyprenyl synthetase family protein [Chlamydiia bacterium]